MGGGTRKRMRVLRHSQGVRKVAVHHVEHVDEHVVEHVARDVWRRRGAPSTLRGGMEANGDSASRFGHVTFKVHRIRNTINVDKPMRYLYRHIFIYTSYIPIKPPVG